MDVYVLNTNFEAVAVVDIYSSLIWTDRYNKYGDFEIYTLVSDTILEYFKQDYYVINPQSEHVMIIEQIQIETDIEDGNKIKITGRSLESVLDRRIVWKLKTVSGYFQDVIKTLLNEAIISPSESARQINNFIFQEIENDYLASIKIEAQYTGDNLYDVISTLCLDNGVGFKIVLDEDNNFIFSLYVGEDRTYDQVSNPYVIFSPNFENILSSNYIETKTALKNYALIGGEGEGSARTYATYGEDVSGLNRRELFVDARDLSSDADSGSLSSSQYTALLQQRGIEKLAENTEVTSFDGEAETTIVFKYGEDFFLGDIIETEDGYSHNLKSRITEIIFSFSDTEESVYPTFEAIEED